MTVLELKNTLNSILEIGMTYDQYSELNKAYAKQGKTSGEQKESYVGYTKLGAARLRRWEKLYKSEQEYLDEITSLVSPGEQWLVFSETWCGDAAHMLPFVHQWSKHAKVPLRIIMRDEHPTLMDEFLTNGGRSIPKLVRISADGMVLGTYGPRPSALVAHLAEWKSKASFDYKEWTLFAQDWYNQDKGKSIESDFIELLSK
ncbi:MAG TPA: thioredoxin family protein [Cryomorphaceae bacterium]|nr:thioredoxin family protein [Cryomorphaceae bacterium]